MHRIRERRARLKQRPHRLSLEPLETRFALSAAAPYHNDALPLDVTNDGAIVPLDALNVVNQILKLGIGPLPPPTGAPKGYYDTNGDGLLSPLDLVRVYNGLLQPTTIALDVPTPSTSDLTPRLTVYVTDGVDVADATPVRIDVDLNNDGAFAADELDYASASMFGNRAEFDLSPALPPNVGNNSYSINLRARVENSAGVLTPSAVRSLVIDTQAATTRDPAFWPFSSSSPWNTPLGSAAQYSAIASNGFSPTGGASLNVNAWSWPVYLASESDPLVSVYWDGDAEPTTTIHVPLGALPDAQSDHSMIVISPDHRTVTEMWNASWQSSSRIDAGVVYVNDTKGPGIYDSYHGARAYGGSALAGLIRKDELTAAHIPHVLAIAVSPQALNKIAPGGESYVWPANHSDGATGDGYSTTGNIYMGSLLAIPPSVNIGALGLSPQALAVARALQDYGAYITETGGGNVIYYAEANSRTTMSEAELGSLTPYLRVVSNNSSTNVGGGGVPRAELAPPFDETFTLVAEPTAEPGPTAQLVQLFTVTTGATSDTANDSSEVLGNPFAPGADTPTPTVITGQCSLSVGLHDDALFGRRAGHARPARPASGGTPLPKQADFSTMPEFN